MVRRILGVMATVVLLNAGVGPVGANEEAIAQARTAANAWFALLDAHEFDESWETAGELLRGTVTRKEWTQKWSATLGPLGAVTSRAVNSSEFSTTWRGAPDGEYVLLKFDTVFENKQKAVETVALRKEADGLWRVSGYFIL